MTATELYKRRIDVRDYEVPDKWKDSFIEFMFGSACTADFDENGNVLNYIYYYHDFAKWYELNSIQIKREENLDQIIN